MDMATRWTDAARAARWRSAAMAGAALWLACLPPALFFVLSIADAEIARSASDRELYAASTLPAFALGLLALLPLRMPSRVVAVHLLHGAFTALPLLAITGCWSVAYVAVAPPEQQAGILVALLGWAVVWCAIALREYRRRVAESRYLQRCFDLLHDRIVLRREPGDVPEVPGFFIAPGRGTALVLVVVAIGAALPLQHFLTGGFDGRGALLAMVLLSWPLAIRVLAHVTCRGWLGVGTVLGMEFRLRRPVRFACVEEAGLDEVPAPARPEPGG